MRKTVVPRAGPTLPVPVGIGLLDANFTQRSSYCPVFFALSPAKTPRAIHRYTSFLASSVRSRSPFCRLGGAEPCPQRLILSRLNFPSSVPRRLDSAEPCSSGLCAQRLTRRMGRRALAAARERRRAAGSLCSVHRACSAHGGRAGRRAGKRTILNITERGGRQGRVFARENLPFIKNILR